MRHFRAASPQVWPGDHLPNGAGHEGSQPIDEPMARKAALSFQREQKQRQRQAQKDEAVRKRECEYREHAIAAAEAALEEAAAAHQKKVADIGKARGHAQRKARDGAGEPETEERTA